MLLGSYLRDATEDHEIRRRNEIPLLEEDKEYRQYARHMFSAYVQHLGEESAEVAALRLLGFFDRAAETDLLDVLRAPGDDGLQALTAPLLDLSPADWQRVLRRLQNLRLISRSGEPETRDLKPQIDSHALLREHFAEELRTRFPEAWRAGHQRLYEHLITTTEPRPDTIEGLQPLYQAVAHCCLAGLQKKALYDIYVARILRGVGNDGFYSWKKLGAIGANLGAVSCFFETPWTTVSPNLTPDKQAWLLNAAGGYLRSLVRLTEAVEPFDASIKMAVEQRDWANAARYSSNLSELELTRGAVAAAVTVGEQSAAYADEQSVTYADRSEWDFRKFMRIVSRAGLGDALHQVGCFEKAWSMFEEAEGMRAEQQPEYLRLYSFDGFRYCDLLLSAAERAAWRGWVFPLPPSGEGYEPPKGGATNVLDACAAVIERATQTLNWAEQNPASSLLDIALDHLTLGRAALYRAIISQSEISNRESQIADHVAAAVEGLRAASRMDMLPHGLLTRAWLRQESGDERGSREDLDEAWEIAERGPMPLFQADILLSRARLFGRLKAGGCRPEEEAAYPWGSPHDDLAEARRLIETHGYRRRDEELAAAEEATRNWPAPPPPSDPTSG